jgi:hypothetical protein
MRLVVLIVFLLCGCAPDYREVNRQQAEQDPKVAQRPAP